MESVFYGFETLKFNYMKTPIEMLNAIIEMQEANYGNATNTHLDLSTLVREAKEVVKNCSIHNVVESAELVACDEQGTPIIGEHGEKICNCAEPWQSLFPDNKYYCLHCWGEWYH